MSIELKPADTEVRDLIAEAIRRYHPDLESHEVNVAAMFAVNDEDSEKPAVKLHGYPCLAVVKINSYALRAKGLADAEITIDRRRWDDLSPEERLALIDHELTHLTVAKDKHGHAKADNAGRPKLKMRLHDVQYGGFMGIAERHGEASQEAQQARALQTEHGQLLFSWAEGPPPRVKFTT